MSGLYTKIVRRVPVDKGWSGDRKFQAFTDDGQVWLLRMGDTARLGRFEALYTIQRQAEHPDLRMSRTLEAGVCDEGAYMVQDWIEGEDAEQAVPLLPPDRQYALGLEAGRMLVLIHRVPAPPEQPDWALRFNAKMDRKLALYRDCPLQFEGAEHLIDYMEGNRHLLRDRPQCFQHGDYHIGNMMLTKDGMTVIDFDRFDFGDPWEEFNRIVWCAQASPAFAAGMADGYFNGDVPEKFWQLLALYIASNTLSSVPWAIPYGQQEIDVMLKQAREVLKWYQNMSQTVPCWYTEGKNAGKTA